MFKRILVAVGGEDPSLEPARVGGRLAAQSGARLMIVSVVRPVAESIGEPYYGHAQAEHLDQTQSVLDVAERLAVAEGANDVQTQWLEGRAAQRIRELVRDEGYDLLILGTRRRGRIQSAILGSVSAEVAAHSSVPVMVVPEPAAVAVAAAADV